MLKYVTDKKTQKKQLWPKPDFLPSLAMQFVRFTQKSTTMGPDIRWEVDCAQYSIDSDMVVCVVLVEVYEMQQHCCSS